MVTHPGYEVLMPSKSIKKPKTYEALRDKGMSKQRAARISNAQSAKAGRRKKK